jgi:hypothetical protein
MGKAEIRRLLTALLLIAAPAAAEDTIHHDALFDEGRLLATGGVSEVEGAGGGGLSPWALITGYGTADGIGVNAHGTYIHLPSFTLTSEGAAVGLFDRVELSYAHQSFDTGTAGAKLGLGKGFTFDQDIYGAKVRLIGNAVYDQDSWLPQISAGLQYKKNDRDAIIHAIGGKHDEGVDYYASAAKLILAERVLVNVTLRETEANQFGILGFGGDRNGGYSTQVEGSAAYLINRKWVVGAEYRTKPDNLGFAKEDNAYDVFTAYFLNKNLSLTLAYVDLGDIALQGKQNGVYVSLQAGF